MSTATPLYEISPGKPDLDALAAALIEAKRAESEAKDARVAIEQRILGIVGVKDEGSTTINTDRFKVTTTGRVTRALDPEKVAGLSSALPAPLMNRLFSFPPKLNIKEAKYVELNEPGYWAELSKAITTKPGRPSVAVKEVA